MSYYGSFVLLCYVLRMRVMTSTVGGNLTNRPPALRHLHVNRTENAAGNKGQNIQQQIELLRLFMRLLVTLRYTVSIKY